MASAISHKPERSILIVEDQPSNALVTRTFLDMMGYLHDTAEDGLDALKKFAQKRYALVIMDVQLPGIDGLEATRRMRALEAAENRAPVPIIAMTSNATLDDKLFCLRAGMNDYMSKPFARQEFIDKVADLLSSKVRRAV